MRTTQVQYLQIVNYLREHAVDGKINLRPGDVARRATAALGFEVQRPKITRTAREAGVELIFNEKRANGAAPTEEMDFQMMAYDDLILRLDRMERKINMLMSHYSVPFVS